VWCCGSHLHKECPEKFNAESIPTYCNCKLVDGEEPHPSYHRGCRHAKEERRNSRRKRPRLQREGCSLLFTSPQDSLSRRRWAARHSNCSSLSRPQLDRPVPPQWEKWVSPHPWGTSSKYQASWIRLIMQTVRHWTTCSERSQRSFSRSWQSSVGLSQRKTESWSPQKLYWNSWIKMAARFHRR
jgi:hypothetical protein